MATSVEAATSTMRNHSRSPGAPSLGLAISMNMTIALATACSCQRRAGTGSMPSGSAAAIASSEALPARNTAPIMAVTWIGAVSSNRSTTARAARPTVAARATRRAPRRPFREISIASRTCRSGLGRLRRQARELAARRFRMWCSKVRQPLRVETGTACDICGDFIAAHPHYMPRRDGCTGPQAIALGSVRDAAILADGAHGLRARRAQSVQGRAQRVQAGETWHPPFNRRATNEKAVAERAPVARHRIHHRADAPTGDDIQDVGMAFVQLLGDHIDRDAETLAQLDGRTFGRYQVVAQIAHLLNQRHRFIFVAIGQ